MIEIDKTIPKMSASSAVSPTTRRVGNSLFLSFYGAGDRHSVVVRFDGVRDWGYGYPNDEGLDAHPMFGLGLTPYEFHRGHEGHYGERAWIGTFHEGTLTVYAASIEILDSRFQGTPLDAIDTYAGVGTNRSLDDA
jgi:hypothetical protein